jgi:hypothetical protein
MSVEASAETLVEGKLFGKLRLKLTFSEFTQKRL